MCWIIDKEKFEKNPEAYHKIADRDLTVYKIGFCDGESFLPFYKCYEFSYKTNVLNDEVVIAYRSDLYFIMIDEGYHSFSEECYIKVDDIGLNYNMYVNLLDENKEFNLNNAYDEPIPKKIIIGEFTIPENSEYYINAKGAVVSSNLIWTGKYTCLNSSKTKITKPINIKELCVGV